MPMTVICPACGKLNRIEKGTPAGETVLCLGCGGRIRVEVEELPPSSPRSAVAAKPAAGVANATEVKSAPGDEAGVARSQAAGRRAAASEVRPGRALRVAVVTGVACLLLGTLIGIVTTRVGWFDRRARVSAEETAELLKIKSEAEQLAVDGKLEAAHAKYRELQERLVGREVKDSLLWDTMERAKVDQDRIYTILLDKAQAAIPPERAMPKPGTGTATRKDDPWYWPRVGTGGRYEPSTAPTSSAEATATTAPARPADASRDVAMQLPAAPTPAVPAAPASGDAAGRPADRAAPQTAPADAPPEPEAAPVTRPTTEPTSRPAIADAPTPPRWMRETDVTDDQIGFAIRRGADFLLSQVKDDQLVPLPGLDGTKYYGRNILVVYAIVAAHEATRDPRLSPRGDVVGRLLDRIKTHPLDRVGNAPRQPVTYARSLRAQALALANRPQDRDVLKSDAEWLMRSHADGAYTYDDSIAARAGARLIEPEYPTWEWDGELRRGRALCDGVHDPRTGRELGGSRRMPPGYTIRRPTMPPPPLTVPPAKANPRWDNGNSQYGLYGVWSAAEHNVEVSQKYWEAVRRHWETCQLKTGEWALLPDDRIGKLAMTAGGVASLWTADDWLVSTRTSGQVGRDTMTQAMQSGLAWLQTGDNAVTTPVAGKTLYWGYDLFSVERAGLATGFKYFGSHDWYRELAQRSLSAQSQNGGWAIYTDPADNLVETAYHILFLSHGRHPLFMNKLRFTRGAGETVSGKPLPAYWANRPRDVANLTRFASRELERPFNWQVVDLDREWHDWLDCPVLYIASHNPPGMTDTEIAKVRQFAEAGGVVFTHADGNSSGFTKWVTEVLAPQAFPGRKIEPLPQDHWIYTLNYDLRKPRPPLLGVSNGSRLLLVHSPTDMNAAWQQRDDAGRRDLFRLGAHIFLYAAGKVDFRNRIDSPYVPPAPEGKQPALPVARIKYAGGDWDPEPGSWRRFASLYQWEMDTSVPLVVTDLASLDPKKTPLAHLTGTLAVNFTDADAKAVHRFVAGGGMLLVDPCGGSPAFDKSLRALLAKAFPGIRPGVVPKDHPLFSTADDNAEPLALRLRQYDVDKLKMSVPPLERIAVNEGVVIISHVDITTGLLGTNTLTVVGYDTPIAQAVVWNLLGWTQAQRAARGDIKVGR